MADGGKAQLENRSLEARQNERRGIRNGSLIPRLRISTQMPTIKLRIDFTPGTECIQELGRWVAEEKDHSGMARYVANLTFTIGVRERGGLGRSCTVEFIQERDGGLVFTAAVFSSRSLLSLTEPLSEVFKLSSTVQGLLDRGTRMCGDLGCGGAHGWRKKPLW